MRSVIAVCKDLLSNWVTANSRQKSSVTSIMTFLIRLDFIVAKFGVTAHYEMNILYESVFKGPEMPMSLYRGGQHAEVHKRVGLASSAGTENRLHH